MPLTLRLMASSAISCLFSKLKESGDFIVIGLRLVCATEIPCGRIDRTTEGQWPEAG
jgi:hypothetical protein